MTPTLERTLHVPENKRIIRRRPAIIWLLVVLIAVTAPTTLILDTRLIVRETASWFADSIIMVQSSSSSSSSRRNDSSASMMPPPAINASSSLVVAAAAAAAYDYSHDLFTTAQLTKPTAIFAKQQSQQNIRYIHLLGERNSGTNYIGQVLSSAFHPKYNRETWDSNCRFVCGIPVFRFKHAFRHDLLSETEIETLQQQHHDVLWILAVRSPCDWADAMFRTPWHLCTSISQCTNPNNHPLINIAKLPAGTTRAKFWSTFPWLDYKEAVLGNYTTTKIDNFSYRNVFALRKHKLRLMQQLMEAVPHRVHIVHLKVVERAPEALVERLQHQFGLFVNTTTHKPLKPSRKPHSKPLCLNAEEFAIAQKEIDWELESRFGFTPLDCHMCIKKSRLS